MDSTNRLKNLVRSSTFRNGQNLTGNSFLTCECGKKTRLMACDTLDKNWQNGSIYYRAWLCPACLLVLTEERPEEPFTIEEQKKRKYKYMGILSKIRSKN